MNALYLCATIPVLLLAPRTGLCAGVASGQALPRPVSDHFSRQSRDAPPGGRDPPQLATRLTSDDGLWTGLMKRPLDQVGLGLLKKRRLGEEKTFLTLSQEFLEDGAQGGYPHPPLHAMSKRSALEVFKKGLDVLGTGLFKRGSGDSAGLAQISEGLGHLSKGVGNGDPGKGVDVDMVRRALDHLGTGLLKRGLDTVGIGLIKRAVDQLEGEQRAPGTSLDTEGMEMLRKGLDHLQTDLVKGGFDQDAVLMISRGAMSLVSWLVGHPSSVSTHPDDELPKPVKETDEGFESGLTKKSLDRLGTGLMKKGIENEDFVPEKKKVKGKESFARDLRKKKKYDNFKAYNEHKYAYFEAVGGHKIDAGFRASNDRRYADLKAVYQGEKPDHKAAKSAVEKFPQSMQPDPGMKKSDDVPMSPRKKALDEIGTGFIKKGLDEVGSGFIKKGLDEVGSGFTKKRLDEVGSGFIKKGLDEVGSGFIKKGLDEVGSGFIKKDLDYIGIGLMKKNAAGAPSPKNSRHLEPPPHKQEFSLFQDSDKENIEWPEYPHSGGKILKNRYDEKWAGKQHSDKIPSKSF